MRRTLLTLAIMVLATSTSFAQIRIVGYSFEAVGGGSTTAPTLVDGILVTSATNFSNVGGTGSLVAGGQASFLPAFANSQNNAFQITDFSNGITHFTFSFTVGSQPISLQTYSFDATTNGSVVAPLNWQLFVNGISVNSPDTTANNTFSGSPNLPLYAGTFAGFAGLTGNVTVDLFAFGGDSNGTWRVDNFTITAIPEPATYALIGLSGVAVGSYSWLRRRNVKKTYRKLRTA